LGVFYPSFGEDGYRLELRPRPAQNLRLIQQNPKMNPRPERGFSFMGRADRRDTSTLAIDSLINIVLIQYFG
jgi:hypothetical protein